MGAIGASNCSSYRPLQPNPDVSGIGVLVGFLVTPYITLVLCGVQYILDEGESSRVDDAVKRVARKMVAAVINKSGHLFNRTTSYWISAIEATILAFSDQQVLTGISILVSGFGQLPFGISTYHWQTVVNLAWLSSTTHLITLTSLKRQARVNGPFRWWRIIAMMTMACLLLCALEPVGYLTSADVEVPYSLPAWCLYHPDVIWIDSTDPIYQFTLYPSYNILYIVTAFYILIVSYATRIITLFPSPHASGIREPRICKVIEAGLMSINNLAENTESFIAKVICWILHSTIRTIYTLLIAGYHLFGSRLWELTWLLFALVWGTIRVVTSRQGYERFSPTNEHNRLQEVLKEEGTWGFGQVIAVALLALPFVGFYEAYISLPPPLRQFTLSQNPPADTTEIRRKIYEEPWYPKLLILWYTLALAWGANILYIFPYLGPDVLDILNEGFLDTMKSYAIWLALDIGILVVPTLFFIDPVLQYFWERTKVGRKLSLEPWSKIAWTILLIILLGISVGFDAFSYFTEFLI